MKLHAIGFALLGAAVIMAAPAAAQFGADINISPKRIVFDGAVRSGTVFVYNRGTGEATYRVELVDRLMTPDGQIRAKEEAAKDAAAAPYLAKAQSSAPMITYTPRRVTLPPNQSQTVRLRVLRPAGLPDGEYRTFLTVTTVPADDAGLTAEQAAQPNSNQLSIRLIPLFSISIPVLVRQGPVDARAGIEEARVTAEKGKHVISMQLARRGASSLFGDIEVRRGGDKGEIVGAVKGIGVYTEIDKRALSIPLTGAVAKGERLTLLFRDDDSRAGDVLASETLVVP